MSNKKGMVILKSFSTEYEANDWIRSQGLLDYKDEVYIVKTDSLKSVGLNGAIKSGRYHVVTTKGFRDWLSGAWGKLKDRFGKKTEPDKVLPSDMNKTPATGVYAPAAPPVSAAPAPSSAADPKPSITDPDSPNVGWDFDWHAVADKVPGAKPRPPEKPKKVEPEAPTAPPRFENFSDTEGYLPDSSFMSSISAKGIGLKTLKYTAKGLSNKFNQLYQEQVLKSIVEKSVMSVLKGRGDTYEGVLDGILTGSTSYMDAVATMPEKAHLHPQHEQMVTSGKVPLEFLKEYHPDSVIKHPDYKRTTPE